MAMLPGGWAINSSEWHHGVTYVYCKGIDIYGKRSRGIDSIFFKNLVFVKTVMNIDGASIWVERFKNIEYQ